MRAYIYFFLHSLLNSIIKLFNKTIVWIIIMTIGIGVIFGASFGILGGVIAGVVSISQNADDPSDPVEEDPEKEEDAENEEEKDKSFTLGGIELSMEAGTVKPFLESIGAAALILVFVMAVVSGTKSSVNLFSMADINFLFTSPLKPQSNLLFRMLGTMVAYLFLGVYMAIVLPASMVAAGIHLFQVLTVVLIYLFALLASQLITLLVYEFASSHEGLKSKIKSGCLVVAFALAFLFIYLYKIQGNTWLDSLSMIFTPKWTNAIPYIGWMKGTVVAAMYHKYLWIGIGAGLSLLALVVNGYMVYRYPADFYEDAFDFAEKQQALVRQQENPKEIMQRTRKRGKLYRRGQIKHGHGASVFFFRTMYVRKRISILGITPNLLFFVAVIGGGAFLLKDLNNLVFMIAYLIALVFYEVVRNFGNPISMDVQRPYLFLIPDSAYKKLMYALLGNLTSIMIDIIPGLILGCVIQKVSPVAFFGILLLTAGLDFFCANTGLLVDMLIPESIPDKLKGYIQTMMKMVPFLPLVGIVSIIAVVNFNVGLYAAAVGTAVVGALFLLISAKCMNNNH